MIFAKGALTLLLFAAEQSKSAAFGIRKTTTASNRRRSFTVASNTCSSSLTNKKHQQQQPYPWAAVARYRGGSSSSSLSMSSTAAELDTTTKPPVEIFRKDYKPTPYTISTVHLDFDIYEHKTTVKTKLTLQPNPAATTDEDANAPLVLDGDETSVKLLRIELNGVELVQDVDYKLEPGKLTLLKPKSALVNGSQQFVLDMVSELVPEENTQLSGLYYSEPMYCTQCEAMGFRRITYYLDRPDVMAVFDRVRLEADADAYPVLLSNGNLLERGVVDGETGRHYAVWRDPFPKPR